jgi:hypothetical protein
MVTSTIEITVYLEGGVIQDITGIPDNGKVTVVDWDTEGVEPDLLTELEAGAALVSTWQNEVNDLSAEWCKCGGTFNNAILRDGDNCSCGIKKHHWHCSTCGRVLQVG